MESRAEKKESKICNAINSIVKNADDQVPLIKNRWRENYDMFVSGSQNDEKEEWQTNFSVNKFQTSIRTAQGKLVNILVNTPDWYELSPKSPSNQQAELLGGAFQKMLDYYLSAAKFKRHAGTFFLCSLISSGNLHVGWTSRMVQNPAYVLRETEKARQQEQLRLAKKVENPQVIDTTIDGEEMQSQLLDAIDGFSREAQGKSAVEPDEKPYVQIGALDFLDINPEMSYWEPSVQYMEDSKWRAFDYERPLYEIKHYANLGFFKKSAVKRIGSQKDVMARSANDRLRYKNTIVSATSKSDNVKLRVYYGPLIIDDEIVQEKYYAVIANENILLKEGSYPYWEPPGHETPIVTAAVRQIPFRATGAGIGDNAVELQKVYDSNWQLVCDTFRFGIAPINIVNYANLVDKSQLDEGVYPGMTLQVRGDPDKVFKRELLTANLENQAHPVQTMLESAIDAQTGVNEMMTGGSNPHSRTTGTETNARLQAGQENVNIIALDLEQNFLIPVLEKCFARVLQYGVAEISSNPELASLLTDDEMMELNRLDAGNRLECLNHWYDFKIKGFSSNQDKNEQAMRDNELLQIINQNGPLTPLINLVEYMKQYFKNRDIKDPDKLLLVDNSPTQQVMAENQVLLRGNQMMPNQDDDHDFHLKMQLPLAQSSYATPAAQQHVQMHMQMKQQMEMMQQQAQAQQGGQRQPPVQ